MHIRWIPISLGILLTAIVAYLQIFPPEGMKSFLKRLDYITYDLRMSALTKKKAHYRGPVVIVDLDEKSLQAEGRWPWSRDKVAQLTQELFKQGAVTVAYDVLFAEPQNNIVNQLIEKLPSLAPHEVKLQSELQKLIPDFDYDQLFAQQLAGGDSVLSIFFYNKGIVSKGNLINPAQIENQQNLSQLNIPVMRYYIGNLDLLQKAAKNGGFTTVIPDEDGVIRRTPLLIRYKNNIYPALGLEVAQVYLLLNNIDLGLEQVGGFTTVDHIDLGKTSIPTDQFGQMIVPYIGPAFSFPYFSATDVLHEHLSPGSLAGKIVFVGTSSLGLGDTFAVPSQYAAFPGVEMHANVTAAILDNRFLHTPVWVFGLQIFLIVFMGLIVSFLFPALPLFWLICAVLLSIFCLISLNTLMWVKQGLVIPEAFLPMVLIIVIAIVNITYRLLFVDRRRKELRNVFGQYVPESHIIEMLESQHKYTGEGETREMTVLFSDIRNFTNIAETLNAVQVKTFLNMLFTPMTKIIFEHKGTVDKYVGDMVMAFWGAPIADANQAENAIATALEMLAQIEKMQSEFVAIGIPKMAIGIGINTGLMHVGDMGSIYRRAYTVLGDEVNLGSRLEAATKFYHVNCLIAESSRIRAPNFICQHIDLIKVKGKSHAVNIYHPICLQSEADEKLVKMIADHDRGMTAYFAQNWPQAREIFADLAHRYPDEFIFQLYLERIAHFIETPPAADWDGAFVRLEK